MMNKPPNQQLDKVLEQLSALGDADPGIWNEVLRLIPNQIVRRYRQDLGTARGSPLRWTEELLTEALQMRAQGKTHLEIGEQFGVSDTRMCLLLQKAERDRKRAKRRGQPESGDQV